MLSLVGAMFDSMCKVIGWFFLFSFLSYLIDTLCGGLAWSLWPSCECTIARALPDVFFSASAFLSLEFLCFACGASVWGWCLYWCIALFAHALNLIGTCVEDFSQFPFVHVYLCYVCMGKVGLRKSCLSYITAMYFRQLSQKRCSKCRGSFAMLPHHSVGFCVIVWMPLTMHHSGPKSRNRRMLLTQRLPL